MNIYQNNNFYMIRKPNGMATTFGDQLNFMEIIDRHKEDSQTILSLYDKFADLYTQNWQGNEMGLVNRLDNWTGGFLRFAKSLDTFQDYKDKQKNNLVKKTYIANVYGRFDDSWLVIDRPIWHHYSDKAKMTTNSEFIKKPIACDTEISLLSYSEIDDISTLQINIKHGVRHQIRAHLASIGKYIVWEDLYTNKWFRKKLSENKLWTEDNLSKYIYMEIDGVREPQGQIDLYENNDIYLDNYLYNRDVLTYHLWSVWVFY